MLGGWQRLLGLNVISLAVCKNCFLAHFFLYLQSDGKGTGAKVSWNSSNVRAEYRVCFKGQVMSLLMVTSDLIIYLL